MESSQFQSDDVRPTEAGHTTSLGRKEHAFITQSCKARTHLTIMSQLSLNQTPSLFATSGHRCLKTRTSGSNRLFEKSLKISFAKPTLYPPPPQRWGGGARGEGKEGKTEPERIGSGIFHTYKRIFPFLGIQRNLLGMLTLKPVFESHFLRLGRGSSLF